MKNNLIFILILSTLIFNSYQSKAAALKEDSMQQKSIDATLSEYAQKWYAENYKDKPDEVQLILAVYFDKLKNDEEDKEETQSDRFYKELKTDQNLEGAVKNSVLTALTAIININSFARELLVGCIRSLSKVDQVIQLKSLYSKCLDLIKGDKNWPTVKIGFYYDTEEPEDRI